MSSRRTRGRGNPRGRQQNIRNQQMDSNGPGSRIRGTPQQILDRYMALARDAYTAGETVLAENLFQHAEHYARILNASAPAQQGGQQNGQQNNRDDQMNDGYDDQDGDDADNGNGSVSVNSYLDRGRPQQQQPAATPPEQSAQETSEAPSEDQSPAGGDQSPAGGDQPSGPPRRRRRSRFQRQQDQDGADGSAKTQADADESAPKVVVPPIDLSAAAAESAQPEPSLSETDRKPRIKTLL